MKCRQSRFSQSEKCAFLMSYPFGMAARICLHGNFLVLVLTLGIMGCASTKDSSLNLQEWKRGNTLWKAPSGHLVVLYVRPDALGPDPQAVVCESDTTRTLLVLSPETFPVVSKQTLNIFHTKDRNTPGWYRLEHTHGLNWWERNVYTAKSLGGWQRVSDQTSLPTPPEEQSRNALLMMQK